MRAAFAALLLGAAMRLDAAATGPGYALAFDGANGFVKIPNFMNVAPTDEITIEFWQNVSDLHPQSTFCQGPLPPGGRSYCNAHVPFTDGMVYWDFGDIGQGGRLSYLPPGAILGTWQHFAFVASRTGSFMRIYRNGVLEAQKSGMTPLVHTNLDLNISGAPSGFPFGGQLDEFRVWNVARTQDQIQNAMFHALTGAEQGLVAYWRFNEGAGNYTADANNSPLLPGNLSAAGVSWIHSTIPFTPELSTLAGFAQDTQSAVLRARINPDGLPTTAWFEWGTNQAFNNATPQMNAGSGTSPLLLSAQISGLAPGVKYFYRAAGNNNGGIVFAETAFMTTFISTVTNEAVTNLSGDVTNSQSLPYLVAHALANCRIVFGPSLTGTVQLTNGPLQVHSNLTIDGNCGVVIDGMGSNQAFTGLTNVVFVNGITFSNCFGANGGVASITGSGSLTCSNCTFINNSASASGGAFSVASPGTLVLDHCTVVHNHAVNGGAIDTFGDVRLNTCTVVSNSASSLGGALLIEASVGASLAVNSCTIAGNSATSGGGIEDDAGTLSAQNSIIADNTIGGGSGPDVRTFTPGFSSSGYNLISRTNASSGWKHSGSPDDDLRGDLGSPVNPLLGRLDDYGGCTRTLPLLPGSPAIDTGSSGGIATDQREFSRPVNILGALSAPDDYSDIGAFEVQVFDLTNAPSLTIVTNGANVILLWPAEAKAYTLEDAPNINPVPAWSPVPATPTLTNGATQLTVTRPASDTNRFFRLRAP